MTDKIKDVCGVDSARLLYYVERIERLEEEKAALQNDIKEIYAEAKASNFDVKAIKELVKIRKKDEKERQAEEYIVEQYRKALGID